MFIFNTINPALCDACSLTSLCQTHANIIVQKALKECEIFEKALTVKNKSNRCQQQISVHHLYV